MDKNYLQDRIKRLLKGEIESKKYTDADIKEKINYFKNIKSVPSVENGRISKKRWEFEIDRNTIHSNNFESCPDAAFLRLEYIMNYGL